MLLSSNAIVYRRIGCVNLFHLAFAILGATVPEQLRDLLATAHNLITP
jgi:hypothetical protein